MNDKMQRTTNILVVLVVDVYGAGGSKGKWMTNSSNLPRSGHRRLENLHSWNQLEELKDGKDGKDG